MTNAEKFEEVFGVKISDMYPADPCDIFDEHICTDSPSCSKCIAYNFWGKRYKKPKEVKNENN